MEGTSTGSGAPVWLNDGTGQFSPLTDNSSGHMAFPPSWGCDVGDVNGDGAVDMVFTSDPDGVPAWMSVWLNDGRGRFMDSGQQLGTNTSFSVHLGDLDSDGDLDLLAVRATDACVWTNNGSGRFSCASIIALGGYAMDGQGLADVDADGDLDAIIGDWEWRSNRIALNDGAGHFTLSAQTVGTGGYKHSSVGDLNGDGSVDLLLRRINVDPELQVWLNRTRPKAGFGKALRFDGVDDYLLMSGVPANQFSGSNDFTIAMWVRPETNGTLYRLYSESAADQFRSALSVQADGRVAFALAKGTVSGGTIATSASPIGWNRWSHVAAVKEDTAIRVCVNGELAGTDTVYWVVMSAPSAGGDTYLGATALPVGGFFRGEMDEIQIWNTALSDAQIADWMYRTPDRMHPCFTNLVAHFDCNEGVALRTTSREGPPIQANFSGGMDETAWIDSGARDWRTWVNHPLDGLLIGSHADGSSNLAFQIVSQGAFGTVETAGASNFTFTPSTNALGTNVFSFQVVSTNGMTSLVANAYVIIPPDYDEDLMEDLWEQLYGLDPSDPSDAGTDDDEDTFVSREEHIADTDPTDSNSFFRVTGMEHNSPVVIYFESSTNRLYVMQGAAVLADGLWADIPGAGPVPGAGGADSMTDTNEPPRGPFYRMKVQLP